MNHAPIVFLALVAGLIVFLLLPKEQELPSIVQEDPMELAQEESIMTEELLIQDIEQGTGVEAQTGATVSVHYTGRLQDGTVFDSSVSRGEPFEFTLGEGRVIAGWEQGILGMKEGGKRTLTIPPHLGYGTTQAGSIPPNSTLIFEVEMLRVVQ
jgi:peptidylprolyl isomerase/FKBP-type peptidyl-prolyl cis-trans isomerase FkpA